MADTQTVQIQPDIQSYTQWAQIIAFASGGLTFFHIAPIPDDVQKQVLTGIIAAVTVFTFIRKRWFTTTISPTAAATLTPTGLAKK